MLTRTRFPTPVLALLVGLALSLPRPAGAEIYIDVAGQGDFPLAVADFKQIGKKHEAGEVLTRVLRRDLQMSGWFRMMDPAAFLEDAQATGLRVGEFDFEDWHTLDTAGLVKAGYEIEGKQLSVEVRVYHVVEQEMILGDVLTGDLDDPETLGHKIADVVIEAFTGQKGPFSSRLVCVATHSGNKEIYVVDMGGRTRRLTSNGQINLSPSFSPGGGKVAYTSYAAGNPDVWVHDLGSGSDTLLSNRPGINLGADWSPDGARIALTLSHVGDSEICTVNGSDGNDPVRLTSSWGVDVSPDWSPDGSRLAFTSSRHGNPQIFVMDRSGGRVTQITFGGNHNVSPAWSPDGSKIAFAGRDKGRFDIFVCNADGSNLRRLTQSPGDDEDPTWSPDGRYLAFSSDREGGGKQIFVMTADGRNITRVTDGRASYTNPDWAPTSP